MFDTPTKTTAYVAPATEIDVDTRYLFKLVHLEDEGVSTYADPAKNQTFHNIRWHYRVAVADTKQSIKDVDGNDWEHVEWTTSKTGKNPKNGMVAKSRLWIEALLGHTIEDEEITPDLPGMILNRYAQGFFEEVERVSQAGEAYTKLKIMRLSPYKAGAKAEAKPAPKPAPKPQLIASAAVPADDGSDDAIPF